jgi:hypothetical protein
MTFAEERTDSVSGGHVPVEVSSKCVDGKGIVGDGRSAVGERRLEGVNGGTQYVTSVVVYSKALSDKQYRQSSSNAQKQQGRFGREDAEEFHVLLYMLPIWLAVLFGS